MINSLFKSENDIYSFWIDGLQYLRLKNKEDY